ncbi:MAG: asparagine synthetase B [Planctomycetes bacterium]|nr:asparagine synthetase B [Planctomycetota bacterium]
MCGIVGARHDWLVANGLDPAITMRDAVLALAWRGPDGQGFVRAGPWWLGCARLAIGPAQSRQPLVRRGGRFVAVMNGAITNARELWSLLLPGADRRVQLPNDAWLPLLAVERGRQDLLDRLRGHHAFAVVDTTTGTITTGRDRYGEKPWFTTEHQRGGAPQLVAFASTPAALRCVGGAPPDGAARLGDWFRQGWTPAAAPPAPPAPPPPTTTDLRAALLASVARCVDTRVPVALSLSGGLDSSCLAAALHTNGRHVPAYQLRAAGARGDERDAATAVAARTRLELRRVDVGPEIAAALPFLTACAGLPLGDPSILAVHALARRAAADGVRVLLSGEGADELLLGYRRYRALARRVPLGLLRALLPRWSMRTAARWLRAMAAPDPAAALLAVTPPAFAHEVLAPGLAATPAAATPHHHDRVLAARDEDLVGYLRQDLLPKVDVACMAAGIEARAPFLEGDCAAFGRTRTTLGKRPLRTAFADDLPAEVLRLPKLGFALPLDRWFRGELPWLDLLREPTTCRRPHLRPNGVARAIDLHRAGKADLGHGLYLLVAYELFLRQSGPGHAGMGISGGSRTDPGPRA